jgi:hypothetical protein
MDEIYAIIQQYHAEEQNESKSATKGLEHKHHQITSPSISGSGSGSYLKFSNEPLFYLYFKQSADSQGSHST